MRVNALAAFAFSKADVFIGTFEKLAFGNFFEVSKTKAASYDTAKFKRG